MFSIHRIICQTRVDYVTFGQGDKVLVIGIKFAGLDDMSDLAIYLLFYRYAGEYKVLFLIEKTILKKVFQLRIWMMTSTILYKN